MGPAECAVRKSSDLKGCFLSSLCFPCSAGCINLYRGIREQLPTAEGMRLL